MCVAAEVSNLVLSSRARLAHPLISAEHIPQAVARHIVAGLFHNQH